MSLREPIMVGAASRAIPVEAFAAEAAISRVEALEVLHRMDVPTTRFGPHEVFCLAAFEWAWYRLMNPRLIRDCREMKITLNQVIGDFAKMFEGSQRAAIMERLSVQTKAMFPDIRRHKSDRQRQQRCKQRRRVRYTTAGRGGEF